nr:EOG090X0F7F [Eulimnadia texana]
MAEENKPESAGPISFKKLKRKPLRKRDSETNEENDEATENTSDLLSTLEETKELQRLRQRPHGVSAVALALGKKVTVEEEILVKDPFKISTGGMVDMKTIKMGKPDEDDAYATGIGTQFSAETNARDEDAEMMKYIEEKLATRKGIASDGTDGNDKKYVSPEELAFMSVPDYLKKAAQKTSEEMLSSQMLTGIPEVELGIDAKIKNIEATEAAKQKLLQEKLRRKDEPSIFVPANMAVNFMQHNRFSVDNSEAKKRRTEPARKPENAETEVPAVPVKKEGQKASDDYHFEKFRKQFRR